MYGLISMVFNKHIMLEQTCLDISKNNLSYYIISTSEQVVASEEKDTNSPNLSFAVGNFNKIAARGNVGLQ